MMEYTVGFRLKGSKDKWKILENFKNATNKAKVVAWKNRQERKLLNSKYEFQLFGREAGAWEVKE